MKTLAVVISTLIIFAGLCNLVSADCSDYPDALFCEDFEDPWVSPGAFDFKWDRPQDGTCNQGSRVYEGEDRGYFWREQLNGCCNDNDNGCRDTYFGFAKTPDWAPSDTIYVRFYVRYGDASNPYSWATGDRSHELKFPDFGEGSGDSRIIIKHNRGQDDNHGHIYVYTPHHPDDGHNGYYPWKLDPQTEFASNTWYCFEFMVRDNGLNDEIKIWVDNNDENNPDHLFGGGDYFNSIWEDFWEWAYRNHDLATGVSRYFYFDDIVISDSYIGCDATPTPECSDGLDNDDDGQIDFPDDPGCTSLSGSDETNCNDGVCEGWENELTCTVDCVAQDWEWYESFDDPADFYGFSPPFDRGFYISGGFESTPDANVVHIDRPGYGKAVKKDSILGYSYGPSIWTNVGVRWKHDLWIGPETGTPKHTAGWLKFLYKGTAEYNVISMGGKYLSAEAYYSDGSPMPDQDKIDTRFILQEWDYGSGNPSYIMGYHNLDGLREEWHTVEIEVKSVNENDGNPAIVKIWIDGEVDIDWTFADTSSFTQGGLAEFWVYTWSATGDFYLGMDEFYKYDTFRDGQPTTECSDQIDNDGDTLIDFPDDLGCSSTSDSDETDCPDGVCEGGETCSSCEADCGVCCPNNQCEPAYGEDCLACPQDCTFNPSIEVCCSGTVYNGNCCVDANCASPETCISHVCTPQAGTAVSVDSTYPGYSTDVIDDGVIDPYGMESTTWASGESFTEPHWVMISFSEPRSINNVTIYWAYNSFREAFMSPQEVWVQYWDGSGYENASVITNIEEVQNSYSGFPAIETTSLRFFQSPNMGYPDYPVVMWLTEIDYFQSYHRADNNPQDGCIELQELLAFVKRWKVSSRDVPMPELMEAIGLWKFGTGC